MEASSSTAQQISPQGNTNDQVSVDVLALTLSLKREFKQLHRVSGERCIYRVPKRLKELNEKTYTPRYVSIGPYHHGKDELKATEEHKTLYLKHFVELCEVSLETFVSCIRDNETRLRSCYKDRIDLSSEKFVRLMLVDAAFVITLMLRSCGLQLPNEDELFFDKPWMIDDIRYDMILLENQLPFFILDQFLVLSNLVEKQDTMVQISFAFLNSLGPSWVNPSAELNFSESKHLVDFLRIGQQPLEQNKSKALDVVNLPSAVELHLAGVNFKPSESLRLLDIDFRDGILEIPRVTIADSTEILFRNIQAFKQIHLYSGERYLNYYIFMISRLVTDGKDVELLTKEGIIENLLHDNDNEQVVHLLHNLAKENYIDTGIFYLNDVVNNLNKYWSVRKIRRRAKRRRRWRARKSRWMASLIQNYFHNPWAVISVIAATLVILLTIVQTICSILQVKQQQ